MAATTPPRRRLQAKAIIRSVGHCGGWEGGTGGGGGANGAGGAGEVAEA